MTTTASLFTGGGLWDIGAMMAGFTPVWGVEIRPDIAMWAELNIPGLKVAWSDVADEYELPEQKGLACEIVGNGIPSLLAQRICESLR